MDKTIYALGFFDGVHIGHQALLRTCRKLAQAHRTNAGVVTFANHPDALVFGDSFTNALQTLLYVSFDETHILDLRHYKDMSLKDYISEYQPDIVLCIQNDTFYYTTTGNGAVWED